MALIPNVGFFRGEMAHKSYCFQKKSVSFRILLVIFYLTFLSLGFMMTPAESTSSESPVPECPESSHPKTTIDERFLSGISRKTQSASDARRKNCVGTRVHAGIDFSRRNAAVS